MLSASISARSATYCAPSADGAFSMPKMRWDCKEDGCFNWKCRPKIDVFDECFRNKIAFGDIDAIVEVCGNALLLEWKSQLQELSRGQFLMYHRLTRDGAMTVLILVGDARGMHVTHGALVRRGKMGPWRQCNLEGAKDVVRRWNDAAYQHPRLLKPDLTVVQGTQHGG